MKCGSLSKISSFGKHEDRILCGAVSLEYGLFASIGADENLKFWDLEVGGRDKDSDGDLNGSYYGGKRSSFCFR